MKTMWSIPEEEESGFVQCTLSAGSGSDERNEDVNTRTLPPNFVFKIRRGVRTGGAGAATCIDPSLAGCNTAGHALTKLWVELRTQGELMAAPGVMPGPLMTYGRVSKSDRRGHETALADDDDEVEEPSIIPHSEPSCVLKPCNEYEAHDVGNTM